MANFTISPGVTTNEIDNTFLLGQPVQAGAAIIGPTVKGPVNEPTLVTSYSDFTNKFGDTVLSGSTNVSFLTSISAYSYFNYGGDSLLVTRVASGSYTTATSSIVSNTNVGVAGVQGTAVLSASNLPGYQPFVGNSGYNFTTTNGVTFTFISASYSGSYGTNTYLYSNGAQGLAEHINASASAFFTASFNSATTPTVVGITGSVNGIGATFSTGSANQLLFSGGTLAIASLSGGVNTVYTGSSFTLETLATGKVMNNNATGSTYSSNGLLLSGSKDNLRFEITNPSTSSGNFNVLIRQGDDLSNKKIVLETWKNVNLDPESNRYIAKVIGDQYMSYDVSNQQNVTLGDYPNNSRYVRVKSVNLQTPNYLDTAGNVSQALYPGYIPIAQNGLFSGATGELKSGAKFYDKIDNTDTQGIDNLDSYDTAISLLKNKDSYRYNVLFTPGLMDSVANHTGKITTIINNTIFRGDALYVPDMTSFDGTINEAITQATSRDTSYAATYWPWVKMIDPGTGKMVWIPASTVVPGVYAFNDKVAAPWFAPAGINRGGLNTVQYAKYKLTQANKDDLYESNINPLATISGEGVVVFGQKTLQKEASALDRVNVRRLVIELKQYIGQLADQIVFEQNTATTRKNFIARVTPYLEAIQQKQGLYAFKVLMDESNNGPAVIDRNQLVGEIFIQPTRTAEFISIDFILMPTGAEFPS